MEDWAKWLTAKGYPVPEERSRLRTDTVAGDKGTSTPQAARLFERHQVLG